MSDQSETIQSSWYLLFAIWLAACFAMAGSLFFSEVMKFPPCVLCWYQRIAMYPLAIILIPGLLKFDRHITRYIWPLVGIGWVIAAYHNLLYYKVIPESASPCVQGVSCTTVFVKYFGFLTIPLMSFGAFTLIAILTFLLTRNLKRE